MSNSLWLPTTSQHALVAKHANEALAAIDKLSDLHLGPDARAALGRMREGALAFLGAAEVSRASTGHGTGIVGGRPIGGQVRRG